MVAVSIRTVDIRCAVRTLRLPPVRVTLTKRRVYVRRFFARPLGTFFFSCFSTCVRVQCQRLVFSEGDGCAMAVVGGALGGA